MVYQKKKGEIIDKKNLTIRTSTIGHEIETSYGLLEWFLRKKKNCHGYSKAYFNGFPTFYFSKILLKIILKFRTTGLLHISGKKIDKYTLIKTIAKIYNKKIKISKDITFKIDRTLNNQKLKKYIKSFCGWNKLIIEMKENHESKKYRFLNILLFSWLILILTQVLKLEYKIIYFPVFIFFLVLNIYIILKYGTIFNPNSYLTFHLWFFYILIVYICAMTFFYGSFNDVLRALPRMSIMPLTLIFFYNFINNNVQTKKIINLYLFFSLIAALSIFYQVFLDHNIEFLVESSTRGGLNRYTSTAGSLTVFGGAAGIFLILTTIYVNNYFLKLLMFSLFAIAAIISLSKAGFMNVVISLIFLIFFIKVKYKFNFLLFLSFAAVLFYFFLPEIQKYVDVAFEGLKIGTDEHTSIKGQTSFRLFGALHQLMIDPIVETFFGYGLLGGQGAFGIPDSLAGTTHNQYGDLFQIGGIFLFMNVISILVCLMIELYKIKKKDDLANVFFYCNIMAIINMFFFNGFLFQPTTSFILWLSLVYVIKKQEKSYNEKNL